MNEVTSHSTPKRKRIPKTTSHNEPRVWAMCCHLGSLAGFIVPLANIVVPLVLWLLKKDEYPFVDDQGKESLNFQISMLIYYIIGGVLILVIIGLIILPLLVIFNIISVIIASIESYKGHKFRYAFSLRFIK